MNLTEEQLTLIKNLASNLMKPEQIAVLIGVDSQEQDIFIEECLNYKNSDIYKAYQSGRLTTISNINANIVKLALYGSPSAIETARKIITNQNI